MLLDSGIATIWRGRNTASAGSMPLLVFDVKYFQSYYGDKTVGITRYWTAAAYDDRADLLIEVQRNAGISTADRCQLVPYFDSAAAGYYKILQVQHLLDSDGQPMTDLTLERIDSIDSP
ncbi:hypothetical protein TQ39_17570 [Ruthenibacterium lactatiformans]|uniref:Head-tail adaptor protein n=1 Tax=Ruthenibacterium lactatiformans TaxID=1550024 RepID=A0A0D8IW63_9FIRM|nr:hypothetical protein [Ruthenibacterium lactatiformans]KJF38531.1 hypothetical protein TQ39_17570 [Ruthenibacterium lactatiformans]